MKKQIANFFWHGPNLSLYENACLLSFLKNGFEVNVWTFDHLLVPDGINLKDVSIFYKKEDIKKFNQEGTVGSLAAFSDAVRYHILNSYGGWWFDTDCFCLKNEEEFRSLIEGRRIIAGWEDDKNINGAVLSFPDKNLAMYSLTMMKNICDEKNYTFNWGDIGPKLITSLVNISNTRSDILETNYFYPVHYKETTSLFDNQLTEITNEKVKNSLVVHLWNEIIKRKNIDKTIMPEKGSFLYKKFSEVL